jgi:thiamine pyrophosphate-dependent acetolactate synthase large subunit-like protein
VARAVNVHAIACAPVAPGPPNPSVADTVGATIAGLGVTDAFGILGSGNLVVTNALTNGGVSFHHARHEGGAITMADGFARVTGRLAVCSVHQGPGLTNTMTGLAEAAKSRTPVLVLAGETPAAALTSNFRIDQHDLVESVGAIAERLHSPNTAAADAQRAYERAKTERRPVVLMLPIDIQAQPAPETALENPPQPAPPVRPPAPAQESIAEAAALIANASKPAIIAGRGAVIADAGAELAALADKTGAVLATSAPANGLFNGLPYALGISGGFASPTAAEILSSSDLFLAFGASLNHWTTKHGALINPDAGLIQVDIEPAALGRNHPADLNILADAKAAASRLREAAESKDGWRTPELAEQIAANRWQAEPYEDATTDQYIDPRTLSIALNDRVPNDRIVAVDSGHFTGYPAMYLDVPDARNWIFANGFQAVGLGLGNAIGAATAKPDTTTVAALGDGGAFLSLAELETAARLKLGNLLVVIYDDAAYGAEVHHFAPMGHDVSKVHFPDADLAKIAQAAGAKAQTVRNLDDLAVIDEWLDDRSGHPLVLDAKVNPTIRAEWLEEAFRAG